jgi:molecular chaperone GrpE
VASTNAKVDAGSQELDVGHELPAADGAESADKARSQEVVPTTAPATTGDELQKVRAERDTLLDRLARTQAELENSRKRTAKEREEFRKYALRNAMESLLPILDSFEQALQYRDNVEQFPRVSS